MIQPWLFKCELRPGESLASFVTRSAAANAVSPRIFLRHLAALQKIRDLDVASPHEIEGLERILDLPGGALSSAGVTSLIGETLVLAQHGRRVPWLVPSGHPVVCLLCLRQDDCYLHLDWRLAYRTYCVTHGTPLQDQCEKCGEQISLGGRIGAVHCLLPRCRCARKSPSATVLKGKLGAWQAFESLLHVLGGTSPWTAFGCEFSYQFLAGVRALATFVATPTAAAQLRLHLQQQLELPDGAIHSGSRGQSAFDLLPCHTRRVSLDAVAVLLANWPTGFVECMRKVGVRASHFLQVEQHLPFWLKRTITEELSATRYRVSASEVLAAKRVVEQSSPQASRFEVACLLGTRDGHALDAYFSKKRRKHSPEEAISFFRHAIQALETIPSARSEREVAERNIAMLLISAGSGATVEDICTMPARARPSMSPKMPPDLTMFIRTSIKALRGSRPEQEPLFVSRFGTAMAGASVRLAASLLLRKYGAPGVWRSADALRGVFLQRRNTGTSKTRAIEDAPRGGQRCTSSFARQ